MKTKMRSSPKKLCHKILGRIRAEFCGNEREETYEESLHLASQSCCYTTRRSYLVSRANLYSCEAPWQVSWWSGLSAVHSKAHCTTLHYTRLWWPSEKGSRRLSTRVTLTLPDIVCRLCGRTCGTQYTALKQEVND